MTGYSGWHRRRAQSEHPKTWKAAFRMDQPDTPVPEDWPVLTGERPIVSIFDVTLDGRPPVTRLVGCCFGDMAGPHLADVSTGAYGRVVIARMGQMMDAARRVLAIVQVRRPNRVNVMVSAALLLPPDNVDILFVCADDETKGAVLKALNVTSMTR